MILLNAFQNVRGTGPQETRVLQDPQDRPTAGELLQDQWTVHSRKTLRMSWRKSANLARRGLKPQAAHRTLSAVVERMLEHPHEKKGDRGGGVGVAGAVPQVDAPPLPPLLPLPQSRRGDAGGVSDRVESVAPRRPPDVQLQVPPQLVRRTPSHSIAVCGRFVGRFSLGIGVFVFLFLCAGSSSGCISRTL
jgi:hypothetical protein